MSAFYDLNKTPRNILNQAIVRAIVSENNGALFDPSDLSTLYQDAVGTIPVTAVEQPVGLMLDKSGNNWHATQSITASRPTLSARKNILLATEALATQSVTSLAATYTLSFTGTGSVTLSGTATGTLTGTGTDRVSLTFTPAAGTLTLTVSGGVTKTQLELGAVAGRYQRVNTATDYDTDERYFKKYLRFDGVDDYLNLPYMGLYAGGSASVVMCGRIPAPITTVRYGLAERNTINSAQVYSPVRLVAPDLLNSRIRDNTSTDILSTPQKTITRDTFVFTSIDTGSNVIISHNGVLFSSTAYARTSATYNNTTIGAGVVLSGEYFFAGYIYSLIITKSALTDAQRIKCERYAASKAGVIL